MASLTAPVPPFANPQALNTPSASPMLVMKRTYAVPGNRDQNVPMMPLRRLRSLESPFEPPSEIRELIVIA